MKIFAGVSLGFIGLVLLVGLIALAMWGCPQYGVYQQRLVGEAMLAKAEQEKQILIQTAKAEVEAASLRAEAINIMGASAQKYPEYRLQEFMGAFADALNNESIEKIIFVPTEANIPIIQARTDSN